jgi:hypothetical protein
MNFQAERAYFIAYLEEILSTPFGDLADGKNKRPNTPNVKGEPATCRRVSKGAGRSPSNKAAISKKHDG